jgi:hypothetical protein
MARGKHSKSKTEKWAEAAETPAFDQAKWEAAGPPMRIIALLSWYDESSAFLAAAIASLSKVGVDHLVAVDGAYALLPDGKHASPPEQAETIAATCEGLGIGSTIHVPDRKWLENEVGKRTFMFELGELVANPDDWFLVLDADEVVKHAPTDLRARLRDSEDDAAAVMFWNREEPKTEQAKQFNWEPITKVAIPILFRAGLGLHVTGTHFTYRTEDGRTLWGLGDDKSSGLVEDFLDLTANFVIDHKSAFRSKHRATQQRSYYKLRESAGIERPNCCRCDGKPDVLVHTNFSRDKNGDLLGQSVHACQEHADEIEVESFAQLEELGIDPKTINWGAFKAAE